MLNLLLIMLCFDHFMGFEEHGEGGRDLERFSELRGFRKLGGLGLGGGI